MSKIIIEVENSAVEKVMWFLEQLKEVVTVESCQSDEESQKINLDNDPLAQELQKRIQEIDNGTMPLTPFKEGMDTMMERIRLKYASA